MANPHTSLAALSFDILEQIYPYLDVRDYLALISTCKHLYQTLYDDPGYWREITESTFRLPNRPSMPFNGALWRKLHKRLRRETKVYLWGQACRGRWPTEEQLDLGTISDVQCGGWSTVLLNGEGKIFIKGVINRLVMPYQQGSSEFVPMKFPQNTMDESAFRIRQMSVGRYYVLAIADDGTIWAWDDAKKAAERASILDKSIEEAQNTWTAKAVTKVVAGWACLSAYVRGQGIIIWKHVDENEEGPELYSVPKTTYLSPRRARSNRPGPEHPGSWEADVRDDVAGEVINYIVLEHYVVFCTDNGKLFAHRITDKFSFQLPRFQGVMDIHGTFRKFGVIQRDGTVTIVDGEYLDRHRSIGEGGRVSEDAEQYLHVVTSLQNAGVVQLAFGDWHYHALHADGRITSYDQDSQGCGALGLGKFTMRMDQISCRGMSLRQWNGDQVVSVGPEGTGRAIWFDRAQQEWAYQLDRFIGSDGDGGAPIVDGRLWPHLWEWIEQTGNNWYHSENEMQRAEDDGLGPYYALSVAAGGWSGAGLVLVNKELASKVHEERLRGNSPTAEKPLSYYVFPETQTGLPNIRKPDGTLLRGDDVPEARWRGPPPAIVTSRSAQKELPLGLRLAP